MEGSLFCLKITIHLRQAHQPAFERVVIGVVCRGKEWIRRRHMSSQATGASSESPYSMDLSLLVPTLPCLITSCFSPSWQNVSATACADFWQVWEGNRHAAVFRFLTWCTVIYQPSWGKRKHYFSPFLCCKCGVTTMHNPKLNPLGLICFRLIPFSLNTRF